MNLHRGGSLPALEKIPESKLTQLLSSKRGSSRVVQTPGVGVAGVVILAIFFESRLE